jgi:hypothetical protein
MAMKVQYSLDMEQFPEEIGGFDAKPPHCDAAQHTGCFSDPHWGTVGQGRKPAVRTLYGFWFAISQLTSRRLRCPRASRSFWPLAWLPLLQAAPKKKKLYLLKSRYSPSPYLTNTKLISGRAVSFAPTFAATLFPEGAAC